MPYYKATIDLLVEADSEAEACDAISEGMREMLREFRPLAAVKSSWIDWKYDAAYGEPELHSGEGFEYADGPHYVIRSTTESELYWSNSDGWIGLDSADIFTEHERAALNLPIGGEWADSLDACVRTAGEVQNKGDA